MSLPVVIIGYILLIPSVIGTVLCAIAVNGMMNDKDSAANLGVGFFTVIGVACFVSGLLGYLLVMKKTVLRCTFCGAVVSAS